MQSTRFFKLAIILLLLVNLATLSFMWLGMPSSMHDHRRPEGGGPGAFLIHELRLNESQQEQYDMMRSKHHEQMMDLKRTAGKYRQRINDQLHAPAPDSLLIVHLCDSIGYCQRDAEQITFYHFQELRSICTPAQQQRFDQVIREAIQMLVRGE